MSYPRNAASPPVIAVGAIYLLADGTIQTTGASARVKTGSGAWGTAAGTLACDSTSGVWTYTPTQGETDAESFLVAVYKSASTSAQVTIATSASATAGYSGVDWSKLTAATSTVNLSGTTISTSQSVASVSGAVGSVTGAVGSVTAAVTVGTNNDKTGYSLSSSQTFSTTGSVGSVTGAVGSVTGAVTVGTNNDKTGYSLTAGTGLGNQTANITGNLSGSVGSVSGSVGSISGVTFPTNFGAILINASGHLSRVTLVDTTTTNTDMRGTDGAALASAWTATRAGYLDSVLLAQNANQRTVQVTGSNHVASDVHAFQTDVIDSAAIAASAVTEIQFGLATSGAQTTAQADLDDIQSRLPAALVGGRMDSYTGAMGTDVLTSGALATSAVQEIQSGLATSGAQTTAQADLDDIQSRLPAALVSGRMDSYTGAMGNNVITSGTTDATFLAEINAEVLDVLQTDLFSELSAIPGASSSLKDKITFLFMLARNKMTSSSTTATLFRDDGTTTVGTSPQGESGGVFTRGEFA